MRFIVAKNYCNSPQPYQQHENTNTKGSQRKTNFPNATLLWVSSTLTRTFRQSLEQLQKTLRRPSGSCIQWPICHFGVAEMHRSPTLLCPAFPYMLALSVVAKQQTCPSLMSRAGRGTGRFVPSSHCKPLPAPLTALARE